ncbi:hypothetical protein OIU79_018781 [Salix purpurea]|uniref:Uncharacterized protein n=1 Tax=Salix purpurea TaxID=77065 RepID=A0A9Q0WYR0_SALPP|nr:hypothetical protein OIU79_018781 [Salix purpurea]
MVSLVLYSDIPTSANTLTFLLTDPGGFISDAYLNRLHPVLVLFVFLEIVALVVIAIEAKNYTKNEITVYFIHLAIFIFRLLLEYCFCESDKCRHQKNYTKQTRMVTWTTVGRKQFESVLLVLSHPQLSQLFDSICTQPASWYRYKPDSK